MEGIKGGCGIETPVKCKSLYTEQRGCPETPNPDLRAEDKAGNTQTPGG
jgi:hypothetical protein